MMRKNFRIVFGVLCLALLVLFSITGNAADWVQGYGEAGKVFRDVTYGGGKFVAVGDAGLIMTSSDGQTWGNQIYMGISGYLYRVFYGKNATGAGLFVAVGYHKQIYTSPNGTSWTCVMDYDATPGAPSFTSVVYVEELGLWVVGGVDGVIYTSPSGARDSWTLRNLNTAYYIDALCYGNGIIVGGTSNGGIIKSTDGINWSKCNVDTGVNNKSAVYANGLYLVGGGASGVSELYYSTNATTWTKASMKDLADYFMDLAWTTKHFIAAGNKDKGGCPMVMGSADGKNWYRERIPVYGRDYLTNKELTFSQLLGAASSSTTAVVAGNRAYILYNTVDGVGDFKDCEAVGPSTYITLTYPKGGETLTPGQAMTIKWSSYKVTDPIRIRLSTNGMSSWDYDVATGIEDSGSYTYTIPTGIKSGNCYIKVLAFNKDGYPYGINSTPFGIGQAPAAGSLQVTAPTAGTIIGGGSTYTVRWTSSGVDSVRVRFSQDGGETYESAFATVAASDGQVQWQVPNISSTNCKIKLVANNASGSPSATSGTFSISPGAVSPSLTILSPKAGTNLGANSTRMIRWESTTKFDYLIIEYHDGSSYTTLSSNYPDTGYFIWKVPAKTTSTGWIWMKGYSSKGNQTAKTDYFSIISTPGIITITSPNGGEAWPLNSKQNITWTDSGSVGPVSIDFSIDGGATWGKIVSSASNNGSYEWTTPTGSEYKSEDALIRVYATSNSNILDVCDAAFVLGGQKEILLNKSKMNFGYIIDGSTPCTQAVFVKNNGFGKLSWTAAADQTFISVSPASGTGDGIVTVSINPTGLDKGTYSGKVTIADSSAINSPQEITVNLVVKNPTDDTRPFGNFATPETGTTVSGSIPITGWAIDDICISSVKIFRVINANGDLASIGDALFVDGTRPDIEAAYPDYPNHTRAGWGYMMLTNTLPDGQYVLKAIAKDTAGKETELGSKTITIDNAHSKKPFGAIDSPAPGEIVTSATYRNQGWALTPTPNKIPTDGSTIGIWIDGVYVTHANYNILNPGVQSLFPTYLNAAGALGYYDFNTTLIPNGLHTISWGVTDNAGNSDGIGSRYFTLLNSASASSSSSYSGMPTEWTPLSTLQYLPNSIGYIDVKTGFSMDSATERVYPDASGTLQVNISELQRLQINLDETTSEITPTTRDFSEKTIEETEKTINPGSKVIHLGYTLVGDELRPLPAGSTINPRTGVFTWQPGPGFVGEYDLVFLSERNGTAERKQIHITINPKSNDISVQE